MLHSHMPIVPIRHLHLVRFLSSLERSTNLTQEARIDYTPPAGSGHTFGGAHSSSERLSRPCTGCEGFGVILGPMPCRDLP